METASDSHGAYTLSYDALNRVDVVKDLWGKTLTMSYDSVGNRTKVEDSDGGVMTSVYDAANNLTKREFGGMSQTPVRIDFSYTALNQVEDITRYSDLAGTATIATSDYSYDTVGRIDHLQHKYANDSNIANYTYSYDPTGNLETEEVEWRHHYICPRRH